MPAFISLARYRKRTIPLALLVLVTLIIWIDVQAASLAKDAAGSRVQTLQAMAAAIRQRHFDAAEGARIAAALEALPRSTLQAQDTQAQLWTRQLREISGDQHFRVIYAPDSALPPATGDAPASATGIASATLRADGLGWLVLTQFPPDGAAQRAAYDAAITTLANARALVIDVRDNRGGDPASVAYLLGFLFKRPPFVSMQFLSRGMVIAESRIESDRPGFHFDANIPIAVLTSTRTFSGGEAMAYELQAYQRACVVGETTGGAANPTLLLEMPHDYAITIPWQRPRHRITGTNWEGRGVTPDVPSTAADAPAQAERAIARYDIGIVPTCFGTRGQPALLPPVRSEAFETPS